MLSLLVTIKFFDVCEPFLISLYHFLKIPHISNIIDLYFSVLFILLSMKISGPIHVAAILHPFMAE